MKKTARIAIITIIIVLSFAAAFLLLAPVRTFTIDGIRYKVLTESGAAGTAEVIANGYNGAVTIPETVNSGGVTYTVTSIGEKAFSDSGLTSVSIPGGVASIGDHAFYLCSGLTSVSIPAGVTSIRSEAFSCCFNLETIVFKGNTPPKLGSGSFRQVPDGLEAAVPRGALSAYETALGGELPAGWQTVLSVDASAVPGVTAPKRSAFPATAITATEQYTGTIEWTPAASSFEGSTAYTAAITLTAKDGYTLIGVPANLFTVEGAVSVSNSADSGVITAVFPATAPRVAVDFAAVPGVAPPVRGAAPSAAITDTQHYTGTVSWAPADDTFAGNTVYTATITLAGKPGYTFTGLPANFFTVEGAVSVSSAADSGVVKAVFPATETDAGDTITVGGINYKVLSKSGTAGTAEVIAGSYSGAVVLPKTADYSGVAYTVVSIGTNAFQDCAGLTSVSLPSGLTSIGDCAFQGCIGLTSISLPGSVTSIGDHAFNNCISLKKISLPASLTSIGDYAFFSCSGLTSVIIPRSVVSIGDYAFCSCIRLKKISLSASLTSIGNYAFSNCSDLTSISLPARVTSIGNYAFAYCYSLTGINVPGSVASIGNYAFAYCDSLTGLTIRGSMVSIGDCAFYSCGRIKIIKTFGSVTIGESAFAYCTSLRSIIILGDMTAGSFAFAYCGSLLHTGLG